MTPQEKLKEIERLNELKPFYNHIASTDVRWLIARVKDLQTSNATIKHLHNSEQEWREKAELRVKELERAQIECFAALKEGDNPEENHAALCTAVNKLRNISKGSKPV